jgi:hypothetical protein
MNTLKSTKSYFKFYSKPNVCKEITESSVRCLKL